ncbi:MAG: flagellin [Staphylothermus sp.]|nr:flagellin [Staphylothermus sp.]
MRRKGLKGIVGIEAAIVLIAFVIVAAALAFVTLNMGFYTTQRSQQVMSGGLEEASSALEVDGSVLAYSVKGGDVNFTIIPLKVSPGRGSVDLDPNRTAIIYWMSNSESFADIYEYYGYVYFDDSDKQYRLKLYDSDGEIDLENAGVSGVDGKIGSSINVTEIYKEINLYHGDKVATDEKYVIAAMIWIDYSSEDTNLDLGEKALLMIIFGDEANKPTSYAVMKVEIKPPTGAALTVERTMPPGISSGVTDLG